MSSASSPSLPLGAAVPVPSRARFVVTPVGVIFVCAAALSMLGLVALFSASASFKEPYLYLLKQLAFFGLAGVAGWVASRVDLDWLRRHMWVIAGVTLLALALVLVPGIGRKVNGARRWLELGVMGLQVAELAKLSLVFVLAHYLTLHQTRIGHWLHGFVAPMAITGAFAALVVLEPDFGTAALTMAIGLCLLFLAGAKWRYLLPPLGLAIAGFTVLVINNPNRLTRFTAYLDVEGNRESGTYQLYQSLAAFAVGGIDGAGLGQGRQQKAFLPEAHTDFIFAIIGEELGLIATLSVVTLFGVMMVAGLAHLRRAPNLYQYLVVAGCLLLISLQAIINLGVVTGLLPTKGMSLPFISAGGSNLLLMGLILGVLLNTQRAWASVRVTRSRRALQEVVE